MDMIDIEDRRNLIYILKAWIICIIPNLTDDKFKVEVHFTLKYDLVFKFKGQLYIFVSYAKFLNIF